MKTFTRILGIATLAFYIIALVASNWFQVILLVLQLFVYLFFGYVVAPLKEKYSESLLFSILPPIPMILMWSIFFIVPMWGWSSVYAISLFILIAFNFASRGKMYLLSSVYFASAFTSFLFCFGFINANLFLIAVVVLTILQVIFVLIDYKVPFKENYLQAKQGNTIEQCERGIMYYEGLAGYVDYFEAKKWFKLSAEQGNEIAQYKLGSMYEKGEGTFFKNYKKALEMYKLSAEQGNHWGQYYLATMYHRGLGVKLNYTEALNWYLLSAVQGNPYSQCNIGSFYYKGQGVKLDYDEAFKWFELSAEQGNAKAEFILAGMYYCGDGCFKDKERGFALYKSSAVKGCKEAVDALKYLSSNR